MHNGPHGVDTLVFCEWSLGMNEERYRQETEEVDGKTKGKAQKAVIMPNCYSTLRASDMRNGGANEGQSESFVTQAQFKVVMIPQIPLGRNKFQPLKHAYLSTRCFPSIQEEVQLTSHDCEHISVV